MVQNENDDNYYSTIEQKQQNCVQLPASGKQEYVDASCAVTFDISRGRVEVFPPFQPRHSQVQPVFRRSGIQSYKRVCIYYNIKKVYRTHPKKKEKRKKIIKEYRTLATNDRVFFHSESYFSLENCNWNVTQKSFRFAVKDVMKVTRDESETRSMKVFFFHSLFSPILTNVPIYV